LAFSLSSRARLTRHDLGRFPNSTLFDRLARAICEVGCLPRKELYETWEMAKRVRRHVRGGRVVDIAGGHGLLAQALLLLDDTSPTAVVVDRVIPPSAATLHDALIAAWPRLAGRVRFESMDLDDVAIGAGDLVVSCHACGALTDRVIERAAAARASLAVLPCCHDLSSCDTGDLSGWADGALAIDMTRAIRLRALGYQIWTMKIPEEITAKNRLLIGRHEANEGGEAQQ
jgi:hypothetical protein